MAPHTQHCLPPTTSAGDFVLFGDVYAGYNHPLLSQSDGNPFQASDALGVTDSSYTAYRNVSISDELQQVPESMMNGSNKQYYSISAAESQQLLAATSAPSFETHTAYAPYQPNNDVPRTVGSPFMEPAPGFVVHPATFSYPPPTRNISNSPPIASPVTSHSSGYSGSESGSDHDSPYNRQIGLETLSEFGFDPSFGELS